MNIKMSLAKNFKLFFCIFTKSILVDEIANEVVFGQQDRCVVQNVSLR